MSSKSQVTEIGICLGVCPDEILPEIPEIFFRNLEILAQKSKDFEICTTNCGLTDPPGFYTQEAIECHILHRPLPVSQNFFCRKIFKTNIRL